MTETPLVYHAWVNRTIRPHFSLHYGGSETIRGGQVKKWSFKTCRSFVTNAKSTLKTHTPRSSYLSEKRCVGYPDSASRSQSRSKRYRETGHQSGSESLLGAVRAIDNNRASLEQTTRYLTARYMDCSRAMRHQTQAATMIHCDNVTRDQKTWRTRLPAPQEKSFRITRKIADADQKLILLGRKICNTRDMTSPDHFHSHERDCDSFDSTATYLGVAMFLTTRYHDTSQAQVPFTTPDSSAD